VPQAPTAQRWRGAGPFDPAGERVGPRRFIGTGEKVEACSLPPERMPAGSRMGDGVTLVGKAARSGNWRTVENCSRAAGSHFGLCSDFVQQDADDQTDGLLGCLMKMIPGHEQIDRRHLKQGESQLKRNYEKP